MPLKFLVSLLRGSMMNAAVNHTPHYENKTTTPCFVHPHFISKCQCCSIISLLEHIGIQTSLRLPGYQSTNDGKMTVTDTTNEK